MKSPSTAPASSSPNRESASADGGSLQSMEADENDARGRRGLRFADIQMGSSRGELRRKWLRWIVLALPVLIAVLSAVFPARAPLPGEAFRPGDLSHPIWGPAQSLLIWLTVIGAGFWLGSWLAPMNHKKTALVIDDEALHIEQQGDRRTVPLADIVYCELPQGGRELSVRLRSGENLRVAGESEQLREIYQALEPDVRHGRRSIPLASAANKMLAGPGLAWLAFGLSYLAAVGTAHAATRQIVEAGSLSLGMLLGGGISVALATLFGLGLRRRRVDLGTDGLRVGRRFIAYDAIAEVEQSGAEKVRLRLRNGKSITIPTAFRHRALASAIRAAAASARRSAGPRDAELDRNGRSLAEWQSAIKSLTEEGGYRQRALRIEDLTKVLDDGHAPPERRVAAAVALGRQEEMQQRICVAADASADPDLRAALEAAAEGEIEEIAVARAQTRYLEAQPDA